MRRSFLQIPNLLRCWEERAAGACLAACGSLAASLSNSTLARVPGEAGPTISTSIGAQGRASGRSWGSTAAAAAAANDDTPAAAHVPLAPCEYGPQAQAANELDEKLAAAGQAGGPAAVLRIVEEQGEQFTELNVISALEALQSGGGAMSGGDLVRSRPFQTLVDMLLAGLQRFQPTLLAQAVHHCGRLGASEQMLLDEVGRHLMSHMDELSAADVAALTGGLAALDHSPSSVLFDALAARAEELRGQFSRQQRQAVADGFRALGYAAKAPRLG